MEIKILDYIDVKEKATKLGLSLPSSITLLPINFDNAESSNELLHSSTAPTVRILLRQAGLEETRLEKKGTKFPQQDNKAFDWVGPTIFISETLLLDGALPITLHIISAYLYDFLRGNRESGKIKLSFVTERTGKKVKKSKKINIDCSPKELKELSESKDKIKDLIDALSS